MVKLKINAGKNISDLYHFTKSAEKFMSICDSLTIYAGKTQERGPGHPKSDFVSLTRNESLISDASTRYMSGFILDGNRVTDRYSIEPISYTGYQMGEGSAILLKNLTSYDDGTYKLTLQNIGSLTISKRVFDELDKILENLPEETKEKKHVVVTTGKRRIQGVMILKKWSVQSPHGIRLNLKTIPELSKVASELANNQRLNEGEERVWSSRLRIEDSLKGIIVRKDITEVEASYIAEGLAALQNQGFPLVPDDSDIGYCSSSPSFVIKRV